MSDPLFCFGVVADVQYADIPSSRGCWGKPRAYRDALSKVHLAVDAWREKGCTCAVDLGDLIDRRSGDDAKSAMEAVMEAFGGCDAMPVYHVYGNHDLSALGRDSVVDMLFRRRRGSSKMTNAQFGDEADACYYDVLMHPGWRLVALDTYDISMAAWNRGHPKYALARRMLAEGRASGHAHFLEHEELNGAVGEAQLEWLDTTLNAARNAGERVVVISHAPLTPHTTRVADAVCWNYAEVAAVLARYTDVVVCSLAGHDHCGGTHTDEHGILHVVFEAALEQPVGAAGHGIVEVFKRRLVISGPMGDVQSIRIALRRKHSPNSTS